MPRTARIKVKGEDAFYHVISRAVHKEFLMGDVEKEKLIQIIKKYAGLYLVKPIGYAAMSNHFHLLIKVENEARFTDEDIKKRVESFYGQPMYKKGKSIEEYREKLSDFSEYMKQVKQSFSWWYNRLHNQTGTFWSERFKSLLVESGEALLTCLAYIDLNPVRAGIVEKPETYRFSSFGYRHQTSNRDDILSFEGIEELMGYGSKSEAIGKYRNLLYAYGNLGSKKSSGTNLTGKHKVELSSRLRYLSDGVVIGSREFIMTAYARFGGTIIRKKERKAHCTGISPGILSIRKLAV